MYIFYSAIKGEFLRTARSTLCLREFITKAKELLERIKQQVPNVVLQELLL